MKTFIVINGYTSWFIVADSLDMAKHNSINLCDHSKEIIVKEIRNPEQLTDQIQTLLINYSD